MERPPDNYPRLFVGTGSCGLAAGADAVFDAAKKFVRRANQDIHLVRTGCLGMCHREPIIEVSIPGRPRVVYGDVSPDQVAALLTPHFTHAALAVTANTIGQRPAGAESLPHPGMLDLAEHPYFEAQAPLLLARCGVIDPHSLVDYEASGGYTAIRRALGMHPKEVIARVRRSGLGGRGGGSVLTGDKWALAASQTDPERYVIANGDEGDPGAFSDRTLMEGDPHAIVEGLMIAAYATGAQRGYIYTRAAYTTVIHRLEIAIAFCRKRGYLGTGIFGSEFNLDIHVRKGSGSYICGEETALIATLEGGAPMPVEKPPLPAVSGYLGHPTVVNNVETLAAVSHIVGTQDDALSSLAAKTKLLSLSGAVARPGVVEVPMGISLREVIFGIGGGIADGKQFKGVLVGGPDGGFLPESLLDTPVSFAALKRIGSMLGSGALVVVDDSTCMVALARYFAQFEADASCGKCTPCRIGTVRMVERLDRILLGQAGIEEIGTLEKLCGLITEGSLCGLGRSAPNPVTSAIKYFADDFSAHLAGHCPTGACNDEEA